MLRLSVLYLDIMKSSEREAPEWGFAKRILIQISHSRVLVNYYVDYVSARLVAADAAEPRVRDVVSSEGEILRNAWNFQYNQGPLVRTVPYTRRLKGGGD